MSTKWLERSSLHIHTFCNALSLIFRPFLKRVLWGLVGGIPEQDYLSLVTVPLASEHHKKEMNGKGEGQEGDGFGYDRCTYIIDAIHFIFFSITSSVLSYPIVYDNAVVRWLV